MNRFLAKVILLSSLGLTGCATNTQTENTAAGALTGALVGAFTGSALVNDNKRGQAISVGIVTGALIGAIIGHYLDSTDHNKTYPILSHNPMKNPRYWEDLQTHITYSLTPISNLYAVNNNSNCRNFHFTSTSYRKMAAFDGTLCYLPNGRWERLSEPGKFNQKI